MRSLQPVTDKLAIFFSAACAVHCLALPLILLAIPSLGALPFADESFHLWMLVAVIPTSVIALSLGCKQHKQLPLVVYGFIGLTLMVSALFIGEALLGEYGEKILTLVGALILATGHLRNYQLCKQSNCCANHR